MMWIQLLCYYYYQMYSLQAVYMMLFSLYTKFHQILLSQFFRSWLNSPGLKDEASQIIILFLPEPKNNPNAVIAPWGSHAKRGGAAYYNLPDIF